MKKSIALKGRKPKKMSQSLSKVYVHITFSTKNRVALIDANIKTSLFEYLGGICKGIECNPIKIGGHRDHVHILCLLSRKIPQMKLLEELKKKSSKWVKTKGKEYSDFYWQNGYGIFSVNPTEIDLVVKYINNQEEHHKKVAFQDEFRAFLKKYKVEYDEKIVWD
jgi:REP element-mobilizing transposase RayT